MISPITPLPDISNTVYVNGFTQPGAQPNTSTNSVNAVILVRIDGAALGGTNQDGIRITGNDVLVRGLTVTRFSGAGVAVINANDVTVTECFLGVVDPSITTQTPTSPAVASKKSNGAADELDPYEIYKVFGNRYGLKVYGGQHFSTLPLVVGPVGLLIAGNTEQGALITHASAA